MRVEMWSRVPWSTRLKECEIIARKGGRAGNVRASKLWVVKHPNWGKESAWVVNPSKPVNIEQNINPRNQDFPTQPANVTKKYHKRDGSRILGSHCN